GCLERLDRAVDYVTQEGTMPVCGGEQLMRLAERAQTGEEGIQTIRAAVPHRLTGDGLDGRQRILDAVLALGDQQRFRLLGLAAFLLGALALQTESELPGDGDG